MRKHFAFALAAALMLTGCQETTTNDSENITENDIGISEPVTEKAIRQLTDEDFKTITLNITSTDDPPPLQLHELDLSTLDFGERLSPCKAEGEREKHFNIYVTGNPEMQKEIEDNYNKLADTPYEGKVFRVLPTEDKLFIGVDYDDLCYGMHDWSIFSYDIASGELKELHEFSDADTSNYNYDSQFMLCAGRLLIGMSTFKLTKDAAGMEIHENDGTVIYEINQETGELTELIRCQDHLNGSEIDGKIVLAHDEEIPGTDPENPEREWVYSTLDPDTLEMEEILRTNDYIFGYTNNGMITVNHDNNDMTITGDDFALKLDKFGIYNNVIGDKVYILSNDQSIAYTNSYTLSIYDTKKMECTVSNMDGYGHNYQAAGNGILSALGGGGANYKSPVFYIVPERATAYRIGRFNSPIINASTHGAAFWDEYAEPVEYYYGTVSTGVSRENRGMLYWFTY